MDAKFLKPNVTQLEISNNVKYCQAYIKKGGNNYKKIFLSTSEKGFLKMIGTFSFFFFVSGYSFVTVSNLTITIVFTLTTGKHTIHPKKPLYLHQMDVETTSPNGRKKSILDQPNGFSVERKCHMVSKLKKSIYVLKQALRQ